jgi:thiol:disulfide interchange protein DsbD
MVFQDLIANLQSLAQSGSIMAYLAAFIAGIFVSLTPCVYPLIPVTIAVIGSQKAQSKSKAFLLSLSYVIGISATYSVLGAAAALTGSLFGRIQTNPWTYFIVGNFCILFGLSVLDVFDLSFLFAFGTKARVKGVFGKGYIGNVLAGMLAGLVVGPCTAPALGVLLGYVAATQRVIFGAALLFTFAMGMGFLLILLGTFTAILTAMPKPGVWTLKVKKIFGLLLILLAEYFLIKAGLMWV